MGTKFDKALPGFNTSMQQGNRVYHIQTEDSGKDHPHVFTHAFLDGNIIATKRESYESYLGREDIDEIVKQMMIKQHKEMAENISRGMLDKGKEFSIEVEIRPGSIATPAVAHAPPVPAPPASKAPFEEEEPTRRRKASGIYREVFRREPTPIPFMPSKTDRKRMEEAEKVGTYRKSMKKVFVAGKEVPSVKGRGEGESDKTLEEIIAEFLSDKLE